MIVNVIGTNFAGKTTLIESSLATHPSAFLDIRRYREFIAPAFYAGKPDAVGPLIDQWYLLQANPRVGLAALRLALRGRPALAERFWRYFFIHASLVAAAPRIVPGVSRVIVDEGLPKKFVEGVSFVKAGFGEHEAAVWRAIMATHADDIVASVRGLADGFILVDAAPDDIIARARQRSPDLLAKVGEASIRTRHAIQLASFTTFLAAAERAGFRTETIDNSKPDAQVRFNAELDRF